MVSNVVFVFNVAASCHGQSALRSSVRPVRRFVWGVEAKKLCKLFYDVSTIATTMLITTFSALIMPVNEITGCCVSWLFSLLLHVCYCCCCCLIWFLFLFSPIAWMSSLLLLLTLFTDVCWSYECWTLRNVNGCLYWISSMN